MPVFCVMPKVERIQTKTLYCQYQTKKAQLQAQNPGVEIEKTLWHGTAPSAVDNINRYGFNRSYCGKNGKELFTFNLTQEANLYKLGNQVLTFGISVL